MNEADKAQPADIPSHGLPPALVSILTGISTLHSNVAAATIYRPTVGNKTRSYQSLGDAFAYESGYLNFRDGDAPPTLKTPFSDGWHDAAAACDRRAEWRLGLDGKEDDGGALS